ncbi:MAG: hypothetical protein HY904_22095 [Deltaproteobacteria bacterium]|nr:hypothetical protein [Deltaproteobacteria bacterium]
MRAGSIVLGGVLALAASMPLSARAAPLDVFQRNALANWLDCRDSCDSTAAVDREVCRVACGDEVPAWEKDGVPPVTRNDLQLAEMEAAGGNEFCYRDGDRVVVRAALCPGAICEQVPACSVNDCALSEAARPAQCLPVVCQARPARTTADCADADNNGLPAWLEGALGLARGEPVRTCATNAGCDFTHTCEYDVNSGVPQCRARSCGAAACTAFHLETVAVDDQFILVHVFYDYSPVPATALDLRIQYDETALLVADARPLPNLTAFHKQLSVSHMIGGVLRLVVFDPSSQEHIRTGPVVEVVFQRLGPQASTIRFVDTDTVQQSAMAPVQGSAAVQQGLANDALWGASVAVPTSTAADTGRLLLWYAFDVAGQGLTESHAQSADELCSHVPECALAGDASEKAQLTARLAALQAGAIASSGAITGVERGAALFNGSTDHVRLPVVLQSPLEPGRQDFSLSAWFYAEGSSPDELASASQLLFAHTGNDERTHFGLILDPGTAGGVNLSFFVGDLLDPGSLKRTPMGPLQPAPLGRELALRTWHHVAFTLHAGTGAVALFLDGLPQDPPSPANALPAVPTPIACPTFAGGSDVHLHQEGGVLGGQAPEVLVYAPKRGPLFQIERMDVNGISSRRVLGDGASTFEDPDYLPLINRVAFSSNAGGSHEIWIADADGSNPRQVTVGFGDTSRGRFARRPRWAPDGTGLIFESNMFTVPDNYQDNPGRGYQLFIVQYDPVANQVAIELDGGGTATQLDYNALASAGTLNGHQLTRFTGHSQNAWWLSGRKAGQRGDIVFDQSDLRFRGHSVRRMVIPSNIREASSTEVAGLGAASDDRRLLAARRVVLQPGAGGGEKLQALYDQGTVAYQDSGEFNVRTGGAYDAAVVTLIHQPTAGAYAARCWDRNHDTLRDADEDRNRDNVWDVNDCYPSEVHDLFIAFDSSVYRPRITPAAVAAAVSPGILGPTANGGVGKAVALDVQDTESGSFVRVDIASPTNSLPIPGSATGVEMFRITFDRIPGTTGTPPFSAKNRAATSALRLKDLASAAPARTVALTGEIDIVDAAAFSPDGTKLLLAGVSQSRPVLLRTTGLLTTSGAQSLLSTPLPIRGMSWVAEQRYHPCNWVGGYQHPTSKLLVSGFRGGLDELKIHAGLRGDDAIRSEAERGHERLDLPAPCAAAQTSSDGGSTPTCPPLFACEAGHCVQSQDCGATAVCPAGSVCWNRRCVNQAPSQLPGCASNTECPSFHLCVSGQCTMVACDPADPYSCSAHGGRCTLRPVSVEQMNSGFRWVCVADCVADTQCFTQSCLNGPCRFCQTGEQACVECRDTVRDYGAFSIAQIEGCPDRNSFMCEDGACTSECYETRDGQSAYVCDPSLEYCAKGRCATLKWDWQDFAPGSMAGLSETLYAGRPFIIPTIAVSQGVVVEVKAYGRGDFGRQPELLVEGKLEGGQGIFNGDWFRVGRFMVTNRTREDADRNIYKVSSPVPLTDLRVRLVHTPYNNVEAGSTGLGPLDKDFCLADAAANHAGTDACFHRPPGSVFNIGYPVEIPFDDVAATCADDGRTGCPSMNDPLRPYLGGGSPAVIVLETMVDGRSATINGNTICSYEGTLDPLEPGTLRRRKLFYGDITREMSTEQAAFCARTPAACAQATSLVSFMPRSGGAYGLLNCNYNLDAVQVAAIDFTLGPIQQKWTSGSVAETANTCKVRIDELRNEDCYEFMGGDATLDPLNGGEALFQTLELTLARSFGHDQGFTSKDLPAFTLGLHVTNLQGTGLKVSDGKDTVAVAGSGDVTTSFPTTLRLGQRYEITVPAQPAAVETSGRFCTPTGATMKGAMKAGATVEIACGSLSPVPVSVAGLSGDRVILRLASSAAVQFARVRYNVTEDLPAPANGVSVFLSSLPVGAQYQVTVASQPRIPEQLCTVASGSGTVSATAPSPVTVQCVQTPPRLLRGTVDNLRGSGLVVVNNTTGETLAVAAGAGTFVFTQRSRPGTPHNVKVLAQPTNPAQQCNVLGSPGIMPNQDVTTLRIACIDKPVYGVEFTVSGMTGRGLRVALNGGTPADIAADGTYAFLAGLLTGAAYDVTVVQQPTDQNCVVANGTGVVDGATVTAPQVICASVVPQPQTHTIGGTVSGLVGIGLRLKLNSSTTLDIAANGPFTFPGFMQRLDDYLVEIARLPQVPPQACTITNVSGMMLDSDITNIQVNCTGAARVTVRFTDGMGQEVPVRGWLVGATNGVLYGVMGNNAKLPASGGDLQFQDPRSQGVAYPAAAPVGPLAIYSVYLKVNGAKGLQTVTMLLVPGVDQVVPVAMGSFQSTGTPTVKVKGAGLATDASANCYWTYPLGTRPSLPATSALGTSKLSCAPGGTCFNTANPPEGITTTNDTLVKARYDLTCWVDRGGAGGAANNVFDAGDLVGFLPNVNMDGSQVTVTVTP